MARRTHRATRRTRRGGSNNNNNNYSNNENDSEAVNNTDEDVAAWLNIANQFINEPFTEEQVRAFSLEGVDVFDAEQVRNKYGNYVFWRGKQSPSFREAWDKYQDIIDNLDYSGMRLSDHATAVHDRMIKKVETEWKRYIASEKERQLEERMRQNLRFGHTAPAAGGTRKQTKKKQKKQKKQKEQKEQKTHKRKTHKKQKKQKKHKK